MIGYYEAVKRWISLDAALAREAMTPKLSSRLKRLEHSKL